MTLMQRLSQYASNLVSRGPIYARAAFWIDSPTPLGGEEHWKSWTKRPPPVVVWIASNYPLESARKAYFESMLKADHASGIETHYDVSNEFYALFLDKKYKFYTCAEFASENDTLEEAQERKAEHILSLLDLRGDEKIWNWDAVGVRC